MTIATTTSRISYPGAGLTGPYAFPFQILSTDDLLVTKRSSGGGETVLVFGTDYALTVGTNVGDATGSITLTASAAAGETLVIQRAPALVQPVSIQNQGSYFPKTHETEFDRLVMQIQSIYDRLKGAFGLQASYDPDAYDLRVAPGGVGQVLGAGAGGQLQWMTPDAGAINLPGESRTVPSVSAYLLNNAVYNVKDFGALGNDATDDTVAIKAARDALLAATRLGELYFPPGVYRFSSLLDLSDVPTIRGAGRSATKLKPTSAIAIGTDCILLTAVNNQVVMEDLTVDGSLVTAQQVTAVHLSTGENLTLRRVGVSGFSTLNSIGLTVGTVIFPRIEDCYFAQNYINIDIFSNSASFPTMVRFNRCETRQAVASGLRIRTGFDIAWVGGKIESNIQEGVRCVPAAAGVVTNVSFEYTWFESNYSANPANFGCVFDGSAAGASLGKVTIRHCYMNGNAGTEKAIHLTKVIGWLLDDVLLPAAAGKVLVDGATGYGWVEHWPSANGDISSTIDDTATVQAQHDEQWVTFAPALAGGGTLAVSAVAATTARYKVRGRTTHLDLNVAFTIATSNSPNVNLTLPGGLVIAKEMFVPCLVSEGGGALQAGIAHLISSAPGTLVSISKLTGTNWANGANNAIHVQLILETT